MEQPESFIQTISGGLDSGFRSLYNSFTLYGRSTSDPNVTGARLPAVVAFMPFIFTDATINTTKPLAVFQPFADVQFTQRRTSLPALTSGELAFQAQMVQRDRLRYEQSMDMRRALGLEVPELTAEEDPPISLTASTMSGLRELLTR
jgi:hypothetical protein